MECAVKLQKKALPVREGRQGSIFDVFRDRCGACLVFEERFELLVDQRGMHDKMRGEIRCGGKAQKKPLFSERLLGY